MGVQGLTLQLAKHSRPQLVTLVAGGSAAGASDAAKAAAGQVLLIDAASLEALLSAALGEAAKEPAAVYAAARAYVTRLASTGLKLVAALPGAAAPPGRDAAAAASARAAAASGAALSPAARWALGAALRDGGCETLVAAASLPRLLLALQRQHGPAVFALLTDNAEFFILGVRATPAEPSKPRICAQPPSLGLGLTAALRYCALRRRASR
jgi:hypothetical protein